MSADIREVRRMQEILYDAEAGLNELLEEGLHGSDSDKRWIPEGREFNVVELTLLQVEKMLNILESKFGVPQ